MSDMWTSSSLSSPPINYHSSPSNTPAAMCSPPPLPSLSSFKIHGNHPHTKVTSPHLPHPQVTFPRLPHSELNSPHLPHSELNSPHPPNPQLNSPHFPNSQVTSPHLPHSQVTSPHLPHSQVTSPHHPHSELNSPHPSNPQLNSPHLPNSQVNSSHPSHPQVNSPHPSHPQVNSPHLPHSQVNFSHFPHSQVTSPHLPNSQVTSPHLPNSQVTSPHLPHSQVTSPHLPNSQVTSPHLPYSQVTSPHFPHSQVTSPHLPYSQVTSPHLPHSQVTSPHLPHSQVTSPHHPHSELNSPHLPNSQVNSSHPSHPQVNSPHLPHSQVNFSHFPNSQVTSPHLPHPQVTSPHLPHPQVKSPHPPNSQVNSSHLSNPQVSSPHLPNPQVNSPHFPNSQVTSPHLPSPQFTSPHVFHQPQVPSHYFVPQSQLTSSYHLTHPEVTSPNLPHPHITPSHFVPHSQMTSPHLLPQPQITSPHLLSPPHNYLSSQNHNPCLDNPSWSTSEPSSEPQCFLNSYSYSYQIQTTAHMDLHLQNQNGFSAGETQQRDELENTNRQPFNAPTFMDSGVYIQGDTAGLGLDSWNPLEPPLSELQCSPLGSGGATLGRWSSVELSASSAEDFQFFPKSYNENNAPQSFCSPTTPGPSPHYPQTPTISSTGPHIHHAKERVGFLSHTSTQMNRNKPQSSCLHETESYSVNPKPGHRYPHDTSRHHILSQTKPVQDQNSVSPQKRGQDVSSAGQSPGLLAGLNWKEECGGQGKRRGGRGGGDGQREWNWVKRPQHENSSESPGCRLQCTVCQRDFRSLPALNGHMRSHSGIRTATLLKKIEDASPPVQPSISMVMPVSVPVQCRGASKSCRSGQRRCSRLTPANRGIMLYRSLMHLKEEAPSRGNKSAVGDDAVLDGGRGHYTPLPMLCPLRPGPGLYCSLTTTRSQRVQTAPLRNTESGLKELVVMETLMTGLNKPRINVGQGFQAQIPPLQDRKHAHSDSHNALLLWLPWDELEHPVKQQRVEAVLMMAQSSVIPGGGVSPEYALQVLSESRGDFLLTVEKLLSTPETSSNHTGWSAAERKLLVKSLQLHHKDFSSVQRAVQTKSLSQCVEFYYLWKKKLSLTAKTPAGLTITLPKTNSQR